MKKIFFLLSLIIFCTGFVFEDAGWSEIRKGIWENIKKIEEEKATVREVVFRKADKVQIVKAPERLMKQFAEQMSAHPYDRNEEPFYPQVPYLSSIRLLFPTLDIHHSCGDEKTRRCQICYVAISEQEEGTLRQYLCCCGKLLGGEMKLKDERVDS